MYDEAKEENIEFYQFSEWIDNRLKQVMYNRD